MAMPDYSYMDTLPQFSTISAADHPGWGAALPTFRKGRRVLIDSLHGAVTPRSNRVCLPGCHTSQLDGELEFRFILPMPAAVAIHDEVELMVAIVEAQVNAGQWTLHVDDPSFEGAID